MHSTLEQLDDMLRRVDVGGLTDVSFGGQLVNNEWHLTDCAIVGTTNNPLGPFPWSFLQEKMTAGCCSQDVFLLAGELVPKTLTNAIRLLEAIDRTQEYVTRYTEDIYATPFLDLTAADAAVEFDSDLAEMTGNVYSRLVRVAPRHLPRLAEEAETLDDAVAALRRYRFTEPGFVNDLYKQVHDEIGLERDDTPVVASFSAFHMTENNGTWANHLLLAMTLVFAANARDGRQITTLPRWAYQALCELGGSDWASKPYDNLDPVIEETARALWVHTPDAPMFNFDTCVEAATSLCTEPVQH